MKHVKRKGAFALLAMMLFLLTACGQAQPSPSVPTSPLLSPAPSGEPAETTGALVSCTISINCSSALESDALPQEIRELLPEDGVLLADTTISLPNGTTAYAMLEQVAKANNLTLDVSQTGSVYVKAIGNLYEKSCGDLSGWLYMVNGEMAMTSAFEYVLNDGDKVEWVFSSDMGKEFS